MSLPAHSVPSFARTIVFVAILVLTSYTTRAPAQHLFDGLPDPSMDNYADLWETITGLDYREGSALLVGEEFADDYYELVAFQAETEPGNGVAPVVGTIQIVESFPHEWLMPTFNTFNMNDGTNNFDFSWELCSSTGGVWIESNTGFSSPMVAGIGTNTIEIVGGTGPDVVIGETVTFRIITPLGPTDSLLDASMIAERIATFDIYKGDPIDPNVDDPLGPGRGPDGAPGTPAAMCLNAYNTAMSICNNNLAADMRKCTKTAIKNGLGGCAAGGIACSVIPPQWVSIPACCSIGFVAAKHASLALCRSNAQTDYDTCQANAYANLQLCLLNNAGIILADK